MKCDKGKTLLPDFPPLNPEQDCPVDRAIQTLDAARRNSCGKDVLCREGILQVYTICSDIAAGKGAEGDIPLLSELLSTIRENASCEMAVEAATACCVLVNEQEEIFSRHIMRRQCPALVCAPLYTMHILPDACTGCGTCVPVCPEGAITGGEGMIHVIDNDKCTRCLACISACPEQAITKAGAVKPRGPEAPVPVGSFEEASEGRRRRRRG